MDSVRPTNLQIARSYDLWVKYIDPRKIIIPEDRWDDYDRGYKLDIIMDHLYDDKLSIDKHVCSRCGSYCQSDCSAS